LQPSKRENRKSKREVNHMLQVYFDWAKANLKREEGQTMAEYGLILALIAVVCITVLGFLGTGVRDKMQQVVDAL
jgi:pilus assembly protein Flp/PilA